MIEECREESRQAKDVSHIVAIAAADDQSPCLEPLVVAAFWVARPYSWDAVEDTPGLTWQVELLDLSCQLGKA